MRITNKFSQNNFMGKVHVYSDFDGTYCPEKHSKMHDPSGDSKMYEYCNKMANFFKSAKDDIDFHITTGRTFGEFEAVSWLLKIRNYRLPLPQSVITKNGSDEFIKQGSDEDFYNNGVYPYRYNQTSKQKEERIKELTNWDGENIKRHVKKAAKSVYLNFVEGDSENSVKDYGNLSLFSKGKLNAYEWQKLPHYGCEIKEHKDPIADFSIGSRNDGKLKLNLIFPPDYGYCPFRTWVYDDYMNKIKEYLAQNNVKYVEIWEDASNKNHYRKTCSITPDVGTGELTKVFDTQEAVNRAINNNDMVIVAGDGSNDFQMLNPLEYISEEEWKMYAKDSQNPDFYLGDMRKKLRDLKHIYRGNASEYINDLREELTHNGFLKRLEDMPFAGIVIRKDDSKLQKLVDAFGPAGKIIQVEKGEIDKGIIQAVKNYAQINPDFKNDMTDNLKNLVYNN